MTPIQFTIKTVAGAALVLLTTAAVAQSTTTESWNDSMMKSADTNRDGMLSRQEFQDHMGKVWDREHSTMMMKDAKMPKGGMMPQHFRQFSNSYMRDPGKIGGN